MSLKGPWLTVDHNRRTIYLDIARAFIAPKTLSLNLLENKDKKVLIWRKLICVKGPNVIGIVPGRARARPDWIKALARQQSSH